MKMELSEKWYVRGMFGLLFTACLVFIVVIIKESIKEHQNPSVKYKYIIGMKENGELVSSGVNSVKDYEYMITILQAEKTIKSVEEAEELSKQLNKQFNK